MRSVSKTTWASILVLVAANLVPIAGVVLWHWQVRDVLFLYWFENIIVGAFFILRVLCATPETIDRKTDGSLAGPVASWRGKLLFSGFYVLFFGVVCYAHAMLLVAFFHPASQPQAFFGNLAGGLLRQPNAYLGLLAIVASHAGWFFVNNPLSKGAYTDREKYADALGPFQRVFVTGAAIFVGGFAVLAMDDQLVPMLMLIAAKLGVEVYLQRRERKTLAEL